jgi:hypothetical protein
LKDQEWGGQQLHILNSHQISHIVVQIADEVLKALILSGAHNISVEANPTGTLIFDNLLTRAAIAAAAIITLIAFHTQ